MKEPSSWSQCEGLVMGVREIALEQWQSRTCGGLAPTPREREHAIVLLAQGLTAAATAEALERDPHRSSSAC